MKVSRDQIRRKLTPLFKNDERILFGYLFGSQVSGRASQGSDIDLAFYLDHALAKRARSSLKLSLINRICSVLKSDGIDVVILNDSPLLLQFQVVAKGKLICDSSPETRIHFEAGTMSRYYDQCYYFKRHAAITLKRIAKDGLK